MNNPALPPPTERIPIIGRSRKEVGRYNFIVNLVNGKEDWNWEPKRYMPPIGWCRFVSMPPLKERTPTQDDFIKAHFYGVCRDYVIHSQTWNGKPRRGEVFNKLKKQLE